MNTQPNTPLNTHLNTSTHRDSDMSSEWQQYMYGKLVQSVNGPIVHGSEHGCTGRSASFPRELETDCHPSRVGLGVRDAGKWAQCAWAKVGGVATAVSFAGDEPYVMCVRQRERSEAGEGVEGRLYAEAHYAVLPAREASWDSVRSVSELLHAEPQLAFDPQLPPISVPVDATRVLPDGWFEQIAPIVRALMSGVSYSLQDWEQQPSQFLALASRVLAAVPRTLRWRLPIGAGMMTLESATAFGYGMSAIGGLRVISGIPRNANDFNFADGDNYLEWLRARVMDCQNEAQLAELVDRELPRFAAFDAIDVRMPWNEAAKAIAGALHEKEALLQATASIDRGEKPAGAEHLVVYRDAYLEMLYERLNGPFTTVALAALAEAGGFSWDQSWQHFIGAATDQRVRDQRSALAMLFGALPVTRPAALMSVRHVDLPGALQEPAVVTLATAFENASPELLPEWASMLGAPTNSDATWVSRWRTDVIPRGVWHGLREVVATSAATSPLLNALRDTPVVKAAVALLDGGSAKNADALSLAQLFQAAEPDDLPVLDALVDLVMVRNPVKAFQLAQHAVDHKLRPKLDRVLSGQALNAEEREYVASTSKQLAKALLQADHEEPGTLMMRALMHQSDLIVRSTRGERLRTLLAQRIGDPFATVLLGLPAVGFVGPDHTLADALIPHASIDAEVIEQLMKQWKAFGGAVEPQVIAIVRRWLNDAEAVAGSRYPLAVALRFLAGYETKGRPKLNPEQRATVRKTVAALRIPFDALWKHAIDETFADVVAELAPPPTIPVFLNGVQLSAVLGATLDDERVRATWRSRINTRGWDREQGWRLINGSAVGQLSEIEVAAMLTFDGRELLQLLIEGVPLTKSLVERINKRADLVEALGPPAPRSRSELSNETRIRLLTRLLELAVSDENDRLVRDVGFVALAIAAHEGERKADLLEALGGESGIFDRMLRTVRKPTSAIELVRSVITSLDVTPAQFVGQHWEAAKKK